INIPLPLTLLGLIADRTKRKGKRKRKSEIYASSSIGRVTVSKTVGWGFEALLACQTTEASAKHHGSDIRLRGSFCRLLQGPRRRKVDSDERQNTNRCGGADPYRGACRVLCIGRQADDCARRCDAWAVSGCRPGGLFQRDGQGIWPVCQGVRGRSQESGLAFA